jgi:hypothetical protein
MSYSRLILAGLASAVLSSGCAEPAWIKRGATDADIRRDLARCQSQGEPEQHGGRSEGRGTSLEKIALNEQIERCMAARGYSKQPR